MTVKDAMLQVVYSINAPLCDDCMADELSRVLGREVRRQQPNQEGRHLDLERKIDRYRGYCSIPRCTRVKTVSVPVGFPNAAPTAPNQPPSPAPPHVGSPSPSRPKPGPIARTPGEEQRLERYAAKITALAKYMQTHAVPQATDPSDKWFQFVSELLLTTGNAHNWASFVSCLMAKEYMQRAGLNLVAFDVTDREEGAPGLDIDVTTIDGKRVVAEVKTTVPYVTAPKPDLGAQQRKSFLADFAKLNVARADYKFFFLTNPATFEVMKNNKYRQELKSVTIVLLPGGEQIET